MSLLVTLLLVSKYLQTCYNLQCKLQWLSATNHSSHRTVLGAWPSLRQTTHSIIDCLFLYLSLLASFCYFCLYFVYMTAGLWLFHMGGKTRECFSTSWGYKSCSSHPTVLYVSLSVLTQLGPHCSGWMRGLRGWERDGVGWGGWVTFLPSGLCVCQPGHSQFSPGKLGGKNFLCAVHAGHEHSRTEACMHWGHVCACMCNVWNWAPGII